MKLFCVHCLKPFESSAPNRLYCTPACQKDYAKAERDYPAGAGSGRKEGDVQSGANGETSRLGHTSHTGPQGHGSIGWKPDATGREDEKRHGGEAGFWSSYDLIPCRDGKARRIEPGVKPLVDGLPKGVVRVCDPSLPIDAQASAEGRAIRLKGYGNAINPHTAALFICAAESARVGMLGLENLDD